MMKKCLIYLDEDNIKNSIDLIEVARQIYSEDKYETYGISINHDCIKAICVLDKLIRVSDSQIFQQDPMIVAEIIEEIHEQYDFHSILIPATNMGRMLAPRLAMRLKVGLVADVTAISHNNGKVEMIRPAFSGKIMAGIIKQGNGPIMLSVRQNVFKPKEVLTKETIIIDYLPKIRRKSSLKLIDTKEKLQSYDIRDSSVLISGGGGIMKNFNKLELLAKELNGEVAASRKIIDKGIATRSIQVGQSGKTVNPKLYIALGISGAIQHVEGLKNVEHIISINIDKNAPICSLSDLIVEGDATEFIDKLLKKINKNK
ncbi:MAG: electron transfer flavoprotein subunit alpha/FixB family protein [Sedimentibacter sp.]